MKKKLLNLGCFLLLVLIGFNRANAQTGSVELKDGSGGFISSHASVSAAIAALPTTLSQAYIIEITSTYTGSSETYPITFTAKTGASATNTVTLRPASGTSASMVASFATTSSGMIVLDDADYVIIDGRAGGTGTTKSFTISNTSTAASCAILLTNGATNNIIRYCELSDAATGNAGRSIAITTSASNTSGNSNNLIEHCKMTGGRYVIHLTGTSANPNMDNKIYGCELTNMVYGGIYQSAAGNGGLTVDSNSFYCTTASGSGPSAMVMLSVTDTLTITRNRIYDINNGTNTSSVYGIYLSSVTGSTHVKIINNFVSLSGNNSSTSVQGIYMAASGLYTSEVYYNTVRISGTLSSGSSSGTVASSAFYKSSGNAGSEYNIKNNIFINERTGGTTGAQHLSLAASSIVGTINLDYNTYNSTSGDLTRWGTTVSTNITDHQNTVGGGNSANDNDKTVVLTSTNSWHLTGSSLGDGDLKAQVITSVANDIENNPRGSSTYKGAYDDPANPILGLKNEVGVVSIDEPMAGTCSKGADVKVTVRNFGTNQVDTFTVNWSVNGTVQTPVVFYNLLDTVLGSGSTTAQVNLGSITVSSGVDYLIKAWTSKPNNITDPNKGNDSTQKNYRLALAAGSYTVGGTAPDFNTLTEVADALNNYGICGPVEFNLRDGAYNERIALGEIAGSSVTNTITFQSENKNKTLVIISIAAASTTTNNYTINLNGTDNIIFRNLTIERSGTGTYANVISIDGIAENIVINDNILRGPVNIATDANGYRSHIYGAATATTKNLQVYNNDMLENSNGFWLNTNTSVPSSGTQIYSNKITANYTGIFVAGQYYPQIYKNNIVRSDQGINVEYYGISMNIIDSAYFVSQNLVQSNRGYGIRLRDCNGYSGKEGEVVNNMVIMNYAGTSSVNGISNEVSGTYQLFAHNTCLLDVDYTSTSTTTGGRGFYMPVVTVGVYTNVRILNNIFYNKLDGVAAWYTPNGLLGITEMDYNLYYTTGENLGYVTSTYYPDFASFKAVTGKDEHSYNFAPTFVGNTDAHILFLSKFAYGRNDLNITEDFDGDLRCASLPTIGADEYKTTLSTPTATFIGPNSPVTGDRAYFLFNGNANQVAVYKWYVNGAYQYQGINFIYTFPAAGNYDIMQIAENCSGADTLVRSYTIADPTVAPTANFSSDRNQIYINEGVQMTDLTLDGPTAWLWSVSPSNGVVISNNTIQDPLILFTEAGKYEICLTAENAIGTSAQRCRTSYIEVYPIVNMCAENTSTFERGKIYDDGGSDASYAANQNCAFFINPCASDVTLKFNYWTNTDVDDKLIIYDGDTTDEANIIATITGGMTNPGGNTGFTAKSGRMWLVWKTDAATQYAGFEAEWTSSPASVNPTVAGFNVPDTLYEDSPVDFINTSTGNGLTFFWDFDYPNYDPDNSNNYSKVNPTKTFSFPGTYAVFLESTNCLGKDTFTKNVIVVAPTKAPAPDFEASLLKVNTKEITRLKDLSQNGPNDWKWEITPSDGVLFVDPATSRNPRVLFNFGGKYTVKMIASNSVGADSLTKIDYIEVVEYCLPNVLTVNTDVTIRRVVFEQIDQSSTYGVTKYSDFSNNGQVAQIAQGGTYNINIERNTNNEVVNFAAWIDLNQDGDFYDADEMVLFDSAATDQLHTASITIPASGLLGITRMRVGISRANLTTQPCGPVVVGEFEDYKINIGLDNLPPVITLLGPNPDYIEVGYGFIDSGAVAIDNVDGNITSNIIITGQADTLVVGEYSITYTIVDAAGNTASVIRKVVITPDVTAPVFALNGTDTVKLEVFNPYVEAGYTATDNPFGTDLTTQVVTTGNVDTTKIGTYILTYTVTDNGGNKVVLNRVIIISDTTKPVISLVGNSTITHDGKTPYTDAGVTVTDNYDALVAYTVSGSVNVNTLGTYTLVYKAIDASGNVADSVIRTINVVDRFAPTISLVGNDIVYLARWQNYTDSGYLLSDNFYDSALVVVEVLGNWTNASIEGLYYIQYRATDLSGHVSLSAKRVIYVSGTNSVESTIGINNVNVYPNPNNGQFTVDATQGFGTDVKITVTNILGATIYQSNPDGAGKTTINLNGVDAGVYFVNIISDNKVQTTKIIIQ